MVWNNFYEIDDDSLTDCTVMWNAKQAFRTTDGYIVRYEGKILVFSQVDLFTQEQIDSILAALKEG